MTLWIGSNALEDLNRMWSTFILDDDGEPMGAVLGIGNNGEYPNITNLFGCDETIWLDSLEIDEDGDAHCRVSGQDDVYFIIPSRKPVKLQTKWEEKK